MLKFILRRLYQMFFILFGVVTLVFILFSLLPSPEQLSLGQRSDIMSKEAVEKELGINQPVITRYFHFLNDLSPLSIHDKNPENQEKYQGFSIITTDKSMVLIKSPYLRRSYQSKRFVSDIIMDSFGSTAVLAMCSLAFAAFFGIGLGIVCALYKKGLFVKLIMLLSSAGIAIPSFFSAIIISWIFGYVLQKYTGLGMTGSLWEYDQLGNGMSLQLKNVILPAIALGIRPLSVFVQLTKNSMQEVLKQDYIRTAYAKGMNGWQVMKNHAIKNALNPVITSISGWFASLLAGAFFTEYIFNWKGLGNVTIQALQNSDLPVVTGCVIFISILFILVNSLVDVIYIKLDPRVQLN